MVFCGHGHTSIFRTQHKTDADIIRENHQFVWEDGEDSVSWDKQLAKKYYDKLFKEYCLVDLSRYKENKVRKSFFLLQSHITNREENLYWIDIQHSCTLVFQKFQYRLTYTDF